MGMPGWAIPLGAVIEGPKVVDNWMGVYKNFRDMNRQDANDQAARDSVDNLAWAQQENDPTVRLANFREVSRDMSGKPLNANTALALQKEVDTQAKGTQANIKTLQTQDQLAAFQKEAAANGTDLLSYGMAHPDRIPLTALQGVHNTLSTFATGAEKEIERRAKDTKEQEKQNNINAFNSAISGLTDKSTDPTQIAKFARTGGYDPNGANDIYQAAATYSIPSEVTNKEVDNYRQIMEKTPTGAPYKRNLASGNATSQQMLQDFVVGGPKPVGAGVTNHPKAAELGLAAWQNKPAGQSKPPKLAYLDFGGNVRPFDLNNPEQAGWYHDWSTKGGPDSQGNFIIPKDVTAQIVANERSAGSASGKPAKGGALADMLKGKTPSASQAAPVASMTATNPTTGAKVISLDGGKSWQPAR